MVKTNINKDFKKIGPFMGLGIQLAAAVVLMFFLGKWFDEKWGTSPWMMLIGILFGSAGGLYNFIKAVNYFEKKREGGK